MARKDLVTVLKWFLNIGSTAIWGLRTLCCEAALCIVSCLAAFFTSIQWRPVVTSKSVFRHCSMSPGRQNCPTWEPQFWNNRAVVTGNLSHPQWSGHSIFKLSRSWRSHTCAFSCTPLYLCKKWENNHCLSKSLCVARIKEWRKPFRKRNRKTLAHPKWSVNGNCNLQSLKHCRLLFSTMRWRVSPSKPPQPCPCCVPSPLRGKHLIHLPIPRV